MPTPGADHLAFDGGPAFPSAPYERCVRCGEEAVQTTGGLSKRELFAALFGAGLVAGLPPEAEFTGKDVAGDAVRLADDLLRTLATQGASRG
jgi:hypothetical protein